jgi:proteasome assembly chaperone (PAC2) family protein
MAIKTDKKIELPVPVLIAGWPGMGNVGIGAADYMRRKLDASVCARMDVSRYFIPDAIEVDKGIGRIPSPPVHNIYLIEQPPLLIFEGETQVGGQAATAIADELLDFAQQHGVQTVYTGAAFASPVSYREPVRVFGVATSERLMETFAIHGVQPLVEGRISGLNGLLLGLAGVRDMAAACFLATMPHYAVNTANPKSSKAIIQVFERILDTSVDMTELDQAIAETDNMLGEFESRVNAALQALREQAAGQSDEQPGSGPGEHEEEHPEPHLLMDRIEKLFEVVQQDRSQAARLKDELDRWGLYKLYEDRFLDLFQKEKRRGNPSTEPEGPGTHPEE